MTKPKYRGFKKFTQTMILSEFELGKKKKEFELGPLRGSNIFNYWKVTAFFPLRLWFFTEVGT